MEAAAAAPPSSAGGSRSYAVQPGDDLTAIAAKFHVSPAALASANNVTDPNQGRAGQQLVIPAPTP